MRLPGEPLFLYGEDLFRNEYFWEAHAVWEELWRSAPTDAERDVLRSFIQLAAARLKRASGNRKGEAKLLAKALRKPLPPPLHSRFQALAVPE